MTVPGGDSGENAQDGTDQPRPEEAGTPPDQDTSPPSAGFEAYPGPPAGYPPAGYPPPGYPPAPPPGPPPGYPSAPGFGVPPGSHPGRQPPGPPPGYPPPPAGYPPPGYGTPYPGGYQPYDQPRSGTNSLAITSLVVSMIGILPFCGPVLSIAGVVLGGIALNQIKRTREEGYGLAVAGIAVGLVTLVIGLTITIFAWPYR